MSGRYNACEAQQFTDLLLKQIVFFFLRNCKSFEGFTVSQANSFYFFSGTVNIWYEGFAVPKKK